MKTALQVGDRVRVYGDSAIVTGEVTELPNFYTQWLSYRLIVTTNRESEGEILRAHPKQCRRLVKKAQKVYYGVMHPDGGITRVSRLDSDARIDVDELGPKYRVVELAERKGKK